MLLQHIRTIIEQARTLDFGKGFDITNLRNMRRFYQAFPKRETLSLELSWSHYNRLARIENPRARDWYCQETLSQSWSVRALDRQISKLYYERLLASQDKTYQEKELEQELQRERQAALDALHRAEKEDA